MNEIISTSLADRRFLTILLIVFAVLALVLASVGIYGVLSYVAGQRISEIGIRLALGAQRTSILRVILGEGMHMVVAGIATGTIGGLALTQLLSKVLYGVSAADPVTFGGVALMSAGRAMTACYIPARRAMSVDPIIALRYE